MTEIYGIQASKVFFSGAALHNAKKPHAARAAFAQTP
jgi:hypothetical protein